MVLTFSQPVLTCRLRLTELSSFRHRQLPLVVVDTKPQHAGVTWKE